MSWKKKSKEPIDVMVIISGSENVDDRSGELVKLGCADAGRFDTIEGGGISLSGDGVCLGVNGGGASSEFFQL